MDRKKHLIIIGVLLFLNILYGVFFFLPSITPQKVDTSNVEKIVEVEDEVVEDIDVFEKNWQLELDGTKIMEVEILNRELPESWKNRDIFFKYTYIGEYDEQNQSVLDELLEGKYSWENQLDESGDIVLGGPLLQRDGIYQLHTHNAFTLANRYFLLGELTVRYSNLGELVGTEMMLGNTKLRAIWEKDMRILQDNTTPSGADFVISTCLEIQGDRRLVSGWVVVEEESTKDPYIPFILRHIFEKNSEDF